MEQTTALRSFAIDHRRELAQALWIIVFAILTALAAQIEIPHQPVPYTLQTFIVLLSGALLGRRTGALSQLAYLALGALGLPVFSGWGFGAARLIGPTGGYLLSFPVAAFVVGYLIHPGDGFVRSLASMIVGLFVIFSLGTIHLNYFYFHNWKDSIVNGFAIFSWWDGLKIIAAAMISSKLRYGSSLFRR